MATTVCLAAKTLHIPKAGGALWAYLNWALGLRALGCEVIWLEAVDPRTPAEQVVAAVASLQGRLERYGLGGSVALCSRTGESLPLEASRGCVHLEVACAADLLLNLAYDLIPAQVVERFQRSALVDIDPGLTQIWISEGQMKVAPHDLYVTTGETVGRPGALFPDCGFTWHYTPPPAVLPAWPPTPVDPAAPFTTVTSWWEGWVVFGGESYANSKRDGFLPFLDLPGRTTVPLELAISHAEPDLAMLRDRRWLVSDAHTVAATPWDYQRYIQASRGEFSCAKPSCIRLQNAWISDRTLCYLASGKPAIVQHTGPSRILPDAAGLFRFRDPEEAVRHLETAVADYERHSRLARALLEEHFDGQEVAAAVLERTLA